MEKENPFNEYNPCCSIESKKCISNRPGHFNKKEFCLFFIRGKSWFSAAYEGTGDHGEVSQLPDTKLCLNNESSNIHFAS